MTADKGKSRLASKSAAIVVTPSSPHRTAENAGAAKTGPGAMIQAMPIVQEQVAEINRLTQELAAANSALTAQSGPSNAAIEELQAKLEATEAKLAELEKFGTKQKSTAQIADLYEVPGRRRKLTEEQYAELKANLSTNALSTPITICPRPEGGYWIISGHNRVAVFKELGRTEIPCYILVLESEYDQRAAALYANLLQPELPDYEAYKGLETLLSTEGKTEADIVKETGLSQSKINRWLSFGRLPPEALAIIEKDYRKVGGTTARDLANLVEKGQTKAVLSSLEDIVAGTITQDEGVRRAKQGVVSSAAQGPNSAALPKKQPFPVKYGTSTYCKIFYAGETLRLTFSTLQECEEAEAEIKEMLQRKALQKKQANG